MSENSQYVLFDIPTDVSDFFENMLDTVAEPDRVFILEEVVHDIRKALHSGTRLAQVRLYREWLCNYWFIDLEEFIYLLEAMHREMTYLIDRKDLICEALADLDGLEATLLPGYRHIVFRRKDR